MLISKHSIEINLCLDQSSFSRGLQNWIYFLHLITSMSPTVSYQQLSTNQRALFWSLRLQCVGIYIWNVCLLCTCIAPPLIPISLHLKLFQMDQIWGPIRYIYSKLSTVGIIKAQRTPLRQVWYLWLWNMFKDKLSKILNGTIFRTTIRSETKIFEGLKLKTMKYVRECTEIR